MNKKLQLAVLTALAGTSMLVATAANAACSDLARTDLVNAVADVMEGNNGGFGLPMWVTMVDETGKVCHVVNSNGEGDNSHAAWLGSRVISAQKANTSNAFSTDGVSISTAQLYAAVQPGASLYGLQHSNPVDASRAYGGSPNAAGSNADYLKNKRIGGVNVFGGGLALYEDGVKIGAIGVSGDTSCTDHVVAWRIRDTLDLEFGGEGAFEVLDIDDEFAVMGDHPDCFNSISGEGTGTTNSLVDD